MEDLAEVCGDVCDRRVETCKLGPEKLTDDLDPPEHLAGVKLCDRPDLPEGPSDRLPDLGCHVVDRARDKPGDIPYRRDNQV
ncbi:hypothetical protein ES703_50636 [subsurface metagenome]